MKAKPGMEAALRKELLALLPPTRGEKGCLNYDLHEAQGDASSFLFHENWMSEEDLNAHLAAPHIAGFLGRSAALLAGPVEIALFRRVG
ncbi:MAG: antibiotic biosynthesis monooxygenase [Acidobacteria bacterium]|nr:antibiotic biosynthesis monooxygenase [Acidobacteriota bacterium]